MLSFTDLEVLRHDPHPFHSRVPKTQPQVVVPQDPSVFASQLLAFRPDARQAEILDCADPNLMLLCTRQFGKTTLTAIKALHFALTHPGAIVLVVSPTARRSGEWIRVLRGFLITLGLPLKSDRIHAFSAVLPNASRLIGLPGTVNSNRGYPAHLLIVDEAAFVPDAVYKVLTPSLAATGGAQWLISSAGPESGFFYEQWRDTLLPWRRFRVPAGDCPRISPVFLARERLLLGESAFQQEFLCEFQPGPLTPITRSLLDAALDETYLPCSL